MSRSGGRERRVLFRRVGSSTLLHLYLLLCCVASLPVCDVPPATRSAPGAGGEFGDLWCIVRCGQSGRGNILARTGVQAGGAAVIHGAVAFNVSTLFWGLTHTGLATIDKRRRATTASVGSGEYLSAEMARGVIVRAFGLLRLGAPSAALESPLAPSAGPLCRLWPRPLASQASFQPLVAFGRPGSPRVAPFGVLRMTVTWRAFNTRSLRASFIRPTPGAGRRPRIQPLTLVNGSGSREGLSCRTVL